MAAEEGIELGKSWGPSPYDSSCAMMGNRESGLQAKRVANGADGLS